MASRARGRRRRRRRAGRDVDDSAGEGEGDSAPCGPLRCEHGGRCEPTAAGGACRCAGGWGGAQCAYYTGRDHACDARRCAAPAFCAWRPHLAVGDPDATYCACPRGAACAAEAGAGAGGGGGGGGGGAAGGAWGALAALLLLAALAALLYKLWTRRRRAWAHSRLADDVHISNPMYLAGADDEPEPRNGNHFANPVYDSMYAGDAPRDQRERDNLLHRAAPL